MAAAFESASRNSFIPGQEDLHDTSLSDDRCKAACFQGNSDFL
jgi:hypothetical protein